MDFFIIIFYTLVGLISVFYLLLRHHYSYWQRRNIVHDKPVLFYGNVKEFGRTKSLNELFREYYNKYRGKAPFGGYYFTLRQAIVLLDLDLVKNVLIKDFNNFAHRGNYYNEKDDPLSGHLFNLDGPKWKLMRAKLTPTFTSGKMKFMFPSLVAVAEKFIKVLEKLQTEYYQRNVEEKVREEPEFCVEVKELLACFTTDVIGSCAFGLEVNSLEDPNTEFRLMGKRSFSSRRHGRIAGSFINAFPDFARKLGIKMVHSDVSTFFSKVVRETVEQRERQHIKRNDFMNILIELKNNGGENSISIDEMAAQSLLFFLAGFETSSSTLGFSLYELAVNQHIQDNAREEINAMFEKYDDKLTYEGIKECKYLHQIMQETLRLYSIASITFRKTINDYVVPGTNLVIEKGTLIVIPIDAIHHDVEIYANPETFDPDRFQPEEIEKRHPCSWLPFGDGPRNCIGLRFGEMQVMVGLILLLKNFKFSPCEQTKIPLELDKKAFVLSSKGGIILKIEKL